MSVHGQMMNGQVSVFTTEGRGHSPEELAEMAMGKIMGISENAPEPIRQQALEYQNQLREVILFYLKQAASSERTTIASELEGLGVVGVAEILRKT